MEEGSWYANNHTADQEITRRLWNQDIRYRVHKNLPVDPKLSQNNPIHISPIQFL
jgi:hypothetical protein